MLRKITIDAFIVVKLIVFIYLCYSGKVSWWIFLMFVLDWIKLEIDFNRKDI